MADLTGLSTNFFPRASETYSNNLSGSISALAATVPVNAASEYDDGDVAVLTVEPGTANEATFVGVKQSSPARFINCVWTEGNTGVGHAAGATVIDYDSATHMSAMSKGILVEHKQNGQHRNINADSVTVNGPITATGDISESGVTARTFRTEVLSDFVVSGGIWSLVSGLNGTMTALTAYINGYRSSIVAVPTKGFTASKDTYVDVLNTAGVFTLVYTEVANNASAPSLAANSIRLAKVVTNGSAITSVVQTYVDDIGNPIRPTGSVGESQIAWNTIPIIKVYNTATITVSNTVGTTTDITQNAVNIAQGGFLAGSLASNQVTIPEAGIYLLIGEVRCTDTENFWAGIFANNSLVSQLSFKGTTSTARGYQSGAGQTVRLCNAGDTIKLRYENRAFATTIPFATLQIVRIG